MTLNTEHRPPSGNGGCLFAALYIGAIPGLLLLTGSLEIFWFMIGLGALIFIMKETGGFR